MDLPFFPYYLATSLRACVRLPRHPCTHRLPALPRYHHCLPHLLPACLPAWHHYTHHHLRALHAHHLPHHARLPSRALQVAGPFPCYPAATLPVAGCRRPSHPFTRVPAYTACLRCPPAYTMPFYRCIPSTLRTYLPAYHTHCHLPVPHFSSCILPHTPPPTPPHPTPTPTPHPLYTHTHSCLLSSCAGQIAVPLLPCLTLRRTATLHPYRAAAPPRYTGSCLLTSHCAPQFTFWSQLCTPKPVCRLTYLPSRLPVVPWG